jgi:hypothetical protein
MLTITIMCISCGWKIRAEDLYVEKMRNNVNSKRISTVPVGTEEGAMRNLSRRVAADRPPAEIVGSNPTGSMDICLL